MAFQAWGNVAGAFRALGGYQVAVHLLISMAAACVLYLLLIRVKVVPDLHEETELHQRLAIALTALCLGFCVGIFYEQYVFVADRLLDASFAVDYGDLIRRLGLDFLGAAAGGLLLVAWDSRGWGTVRARLRG